MVILYRSSYKIVIISSSTYNICHYLWQYIISSSTYKIGVISSSTYKIVLISNSTYKIVVISSSYSYDHIS